MRKISSWNGGNDLFLALNPVAFQPGNLNVKWYGVFMATGALIATTMAIIEDKKWQIMSDDFIDFLLWAIPIGFIGVRTYYVIFEWGYFLQHSDQIIVIWNGGIMIYGGLLAGSVMLLILCRNRILPPLLMLDITTPGVLAVQILGRWGNFTNQEAYGARTSLTFLQSLYLSEFTIKQMYTNGYYHQPMFLHEPFFNFIGLVLILMFRHKKGLFKQGEVFANHIIWYPTVRFFVEGMRTDSLYIFNVIRASQALSLVLFIAAIIFIIYRRKQDSVAWYLDGSGLKFPYER